ncbi:modifier of mdg4-like isoform X11 [Cylas formicarius]|uniref:modifier of mdg4-like isoform X11 n=1 Tax=Cylas formicarius TaxID=197179 RepID=UPI00295844D4|nr:modifier of mdg4-like isoform X11 [Cylas formicarius]
MASEQFSLCWDNFHKNMSSGMNSLLENEDLVDVTLAVEGKCLKAHKMVLSVCSPYFKELFKSNPCQHPIVFMKDVSYVAISDLLQFMYQGEVQVSQENLTTFIKTAEALQIKGLTGDGNGSVDNDESVHEKSTPAPEDTYKPVPRPKKQPPTPVVSSTPAPKRQRLSDSQPTPSAVVTKTEPVNSSSAETPPVQFKVEPYDQNQTLTIPDDDGDNFGDDTLDDNTADDTEDYSMMEGEEPQAGTSTDGAGEGQGIGRCRRKIVIDGYAYGTLYKALGKTMLRCSSRKKGCRGRGFIPDGKGTESFVLVTDHIHPPNHYLAKRHEMTKTLKHYAATLPGRPIDIYNSVVSIHPDMEELWPFNIAVRTINKVRQKVKRELGIPI